MALRYRIVCDGCGNDKLYRVPHLALGYRPGFKGSAHDQHFCGTGCLTKYMGNVATILDTHGKEYNSARAPK